jgi:acyl-coenzyme A thioesterase PaaI-like protein
MPSIYDRYQQISKLPAGKYLFSKMVGFGAPFFRYLHATVVELSPAYCKVQMKDRRGLHNHLGTINAGALCSLAEMCGGMALDAAIDPSLRWIPKAMTVKYLLKATGTITAISEFAANNIGPGEFIVPIVVSNADGESVFSADISFHISAKPSQT